MSRTFTVLGATGNIGKQVATVLLSAGHHVRVPVRNVESPAALELKNAGASLMASGFVAGDEKMGTLSINQDFLTQALTGVEGVYALIPPNLTSTKPDEETNAFLEVLKSAVLASKVPRIVILSSVGAQTVGHIGALEELRRFEAVFAPLAGPHLEVVILRPGYFFTNLLLTLPGALADGVLVGGYSNTLPLPFISTDDIADEAAERLLAKKDEKKHLHIIELSGPAEYTHDDAAKFISTLVGKEIVYAQIPSEELSGAFQALGASPAMGDFYVGMYDAGNKGLIFYEFPEQLKRKTRTLEDYLAAQLKQ